MSYNNNINTGLAAKVDSFKWSGSTDNKPHVIGFKTTAPDFSIPPTPASSYQNIHVVLDHVHPSSITTRTEVLSEPMQVRTESRSFSSLPSFTDNTPAMTPMPALVVLDEFDLTERTDRSLPASVDISLFDETEAALASRSLTKDWVLMEEEERSWRMSREVDSKWSSNWSRVSRQLLGGSFNLSSLEDSERQWRMSRSVDQSWKSNWGLVSKQLLGRSYNLNNLEERERRWRLSRSVDANWSAEWKLVGQELLSNNYALELSLKELNDFALQLSVEIEKEVDRIVANVNAMGPVLEKFERDIDRAAWERFTVMEEEERSYRVARKVDPVFFGNWHKVGLELKSVVGLSWSEWFDNLKMKTYNKTSKAVDTLEHLELPSITLPSLPVVDFSGITLPSLPEVHLPEISLPDLKIGVVKSEATTPMYNDSVLVDFTFRSNRVPQEIIALEEAERSYRMSRGVNPVALGLWFRAGQELKYKYSLRPTFSGLGESLAEGATALADRAINTVGSLIESAQVAIASAEESMIPAPATEFAEHKHLNFYAFTAEKIDFTFKSRRTPAYIIALEEAERADRIKRYSANRAAYRQWNKFLVENLPKSNIERAEGAFLNAVHKAETGISGFFGSIAHSVATTLHMAKEEPAKTDIKVDPLAAARKGRVNDELIHMTVKSV